jgi:hypothetical protein
LPPEIVPVPVSAAITSAPWAGLSIAPRRQTTTFW